jgi:hypothetical protein
MLLSVGLLTILLIWSPSIPATENKPRPSQAAEIDEQKMARRIAAESLWRLKYAIKKDDFYSARVALNVWQSAAQEAGNFDAQVYADFKRQIYTSSVQSSLKCVEIAIARQAFHDARICLYRWHEHSKQLGTFDPEQFAFYNEQIQQQEALKSP